MPVAVQEDRSPEACCPLENEEIAVSKAIVAKELQRELPIQNLIRRLKHVEYVEMH